MSDDIECPYCGKAHDHDGESYEEDGGYHWQCSACDKNFIMNPHHSISFSTHKADCLNGSDHVFKQSFTVPIEYTRMKCSDCGERRKPTDKEWLAIKESRKK